MLHTHRACNSCNRAFSKAFVDTGERSLSLLYSAVGGAVTNAVIILSYPMHLVTNSILFKRVL